MTETTADACAGTLDLTRSEQWVLHHAMLRELEAAADDGETEPWWAIAVLEQVESQGTLSLTCFEAWRVKRSLRTYADDAPARDVDAAEDVAGRLSAAYESPPLAAP
ncbi:DUF7853 family protein [Halostella litorea]|uniref:DUF7853 family protein n=1 Tax=Halostella litorea TaxID=2528831 RepID=UPI00109300D7|nr:hypothetical protein [Halostella litorea]